MVPENAPSSKLRISWNATKIQNGRKYQNSSIRCWKTTKNSSIFITSGENFEPKGSGGRGGLSNERYVITRLKAKEFKKYQGFTDDDEEYIRLVLRGYEDGVIPKNTTKNIKEKKIEKGKVNPLKVLAILKKKHSQ